VDGRRTASRPVSIVEQSPEYAVEPGVVKAGDKSVAGMISHCGALPGGFVCQGPAPQGGGNCALTAYIKAPGWSPLARLQESARPAEPKVENPRRVRQTSPVKWIQLVVLCLVPAGFAGCQKTGPPSPPPVAEHQYPTQAQPHLPTLKIYLGAETLDAELALSPIQEETGMMFRTNILDTDAMLFVLPYPQHADFWMYHCPESISAAYITTEGIIAEIHHLEKNDTNGVVAAADNIQFVLETSDGWFARHHVTPGMGVKTERGSLAETFLPH